MKHLVILVNPSMIQVFKSKKIVSRKGRIFLTLLNEKTPSDPVILQRLQKGTQKNNYAKNILKLSVLKRLSKILNVKKSGLHVGGLKVKPITQELIVEIGKKVKIWEVFEK